MIESNAATRLHGLDTLRAAAIALVLMTHYGFVSHERTFGIGSDLGWAGVDLFFVLSGYLIGNQILSCFARHEPFSLKAFFARRLLRTLPNYYVVLAVYVLFPTSPIAGSSAAPLWRFLTFTQNFGQAYGQTFTHSWSLCIEEQFYLILPLVALWIARSRKSVPLAWGAIVGAMATAMAVRAHAYLVDGFDASAAEVYYSSLTRFDELLPGVAIAMLKNFHPDVFKRLLQRGNALLLAGLALVAGVLVCFSARAPYSLPLTVFGYTALSSGFALMVCSALSPTSVLARVRVPGATSLALWSYAVYLVHKPVYMALRPVLLSKGIDPGAPLTIIAVVSAGVFGGWLLYRLVETPFMQLRARWYPARNPMPALATA